MFATALSPRRAGGCWRYSPRLGPGLHPCAAGGCHLLLLFACERAVQRLVEGSLVLFVIRGGNLALLALDFQLEQFLFKSFQQQPGALLRCSRGWSRGGARDLRLRGAGADAGG